MIPLNQVGETKHFPPAVKEWKNSIYVYNKNSLKRLPAKDEMVNNLIKSYFNLSNNKRIARSRRMRSLIRKKTPKKIFVSKSEIKQTNDKATITVYTFNKERQYLIRKMFFYNRKPRLLDLWRKNNLTKLNLKSFNKSLVTNRINRNKTFITKSINLQLEFNKTRKRRISLIKKTKKRGLAIIVRLSKRKRISNLKTRLNRLKRLNKINYLYLNRYKIKSFTRKRSNMFKKRLKRIIPYSGIKLKNELNFLTFKVLSKKKQFTVLRKLFYYNFLKYVLSMFKIKVFAYMFEINSLMSVLSKRKKNEKKYLNKKARKKRKLYQLALTMLPLIDKFKKGSNKICFVSGKSKIWVNLNLNDKLQHLQNNKLERMNYIMLKKNLIVSQFLTNILLKSKVKDVENKLYLLFNSYCKKYYLKFLAKISKKQVYLTNNYTRLALNRFKFSKFLPGLKLMISKIYSKKAELNIVDLKYPHLNTDIFTEAIASKLKAKRPGLLKVLKKSMQLVKLPYEFVNKATINSDYNLNLIDSLKIHKSIKLDDLQKNKKFTANRSFSIDYLQNVLEKIYPRSFSLSEESININNVLTKGTIFKTEKLSKKTKTMKAKLMNVLSSVKYKWVTGARVEVAGRITRRYTAARSVFKFKHKGSLKNIDFTRKSEVLKKSMPTVKLRNIAKGNSQYTFANSKRRIGAFGVKGWISGF